MRTEFWGKWIKIMKSRRYDSLIERRSILESSYHNIISSSEQPCSYFIIVYEDNYFKIIKKAKGCENKPVYLISSYIEERTYSNIYIYTDYYKLQNYCNNVKKIKNMHVCIYDITLIPIGRRVKRHADDKMTKSKRNIVLANSNGSNMKYLYTSVYSLQARIMTYLLYD